VAARVVVDFPLPDGTEIENQGTLAAAELPAPVPTDGDPALAGQQPTRVVVSSSTDLLLLKRVRDVNGDELLPGDELRYVIEVVNAGTATATAVAVNDDLPPVVHGLDVQHVPAGAVDRSRTTGGAYGRGVIDVDGFDVAGAARDSIVFTVRVDAPVAGGTRVVNQARVTSSEHADPRLSDGDPAVPGVQPTAIEISARPRLTARKEAIVESGELPGPGDVISYVIVLGNEGTAAATGIVVTDPIPRYTDYVAGTIKVNGEPRTDSGADGDGVDFGETRPGAVTVQIGTLAPGEIATLAFQVRVDTELSTAQMIVNRAEVRAFEFDDVIMSNDPDGDGPTEVSIDPAAVGARLSPVEPAMNPVRTDDVALRYRGVGAPVTLSIFNLVGERVRIFGGLPEAGTVTWRLDNDAGRSVANGTYLVLLNSPGTTHSYRLVVAR
jgi:uncharacterized repeat protein (TIGR01451 family)